jgi:hypothetical protein
LANLDRSALWERAASVSEPGEGFMLAPNPDSLLRNLKFSMAFSMTYKSLIANVLFKFLY